MTDSFAHFTLLETLGDGQLGTLSRARDSRSGRTVALRRLTLAAAADGALLDRLRQASVLSHPSVAGLYEVGVHDGTTYYAQEFVPGRGLSELAAGHPLHPRRAIEFAVAIADALAEAESLGLVHGALTSRAVRVNPKGHAKLLDVGFAGWPHGSAAVPDLEALGTLLRELVTGHTTRVATVPEPLIRVLDRCASGQMGSAAVVAATLREIAASMEVGQPGPASQPSPASSGLGARWIVAGTVIAVVAGLLWLAR